MNPYEEERWNDYYQERLAFMEDSGVENAQRKAIHDTAHQLGPGPPWSWGLGAGRGWVSSSRFGPGQVIPRANRAQQRERGVFKRP